MGERPAGDEGWMLSKGQVDKITHATELSVDRPGFLAK